MLATRFIELLQRVIEEHGDHEIQDEYGKYLDSPEFNDDDGPCILISLDDMPT